MGREAECRCAVGDRQAPAKVLLEAKELIIRGALRRTIAISAIKAARVEGDNLCFTIDGDSVSLALGAKMAQRWLDALRKPFPTLAQKLGIHSTSIIHLIGKNASDELASALLEGKLSNTGTPEILIACVSKHEDLLARWDAAGPWAEKGVPFWVVYPKGSGSPVGEAFVRDFLRKRGLRDTKVASVSATLTALRFSKPRSTVV